MKMTQRAGRTAIAPATSRPAAAGDPAPRTASLVGSYPPDDLAVIRVDNPSGLQPATFADSAKAQAGDVVLAIGNPLGLSGSVTSGIISATGRVCAPVTSSRRRAARPRRTPRRWRGCWPPLTRASSSPSRSSATDRSGP